MKTKTLKQILAIIALATTLLITNAGISNAALQANPNTQYTKSTAPETWMSEFRKMESAGGAMGLSETLNSDLTASNNNSNGIDVHMMKTTEYGAIAILSASGYGNSSNSQAITTTTGNATGIILNTSYWEWNAGGLEDSIFSGTNSKYYDSYTSSQTSARVGDSLGTKSTTNPGCSGWHSATKADWVQSALPYFLRTSGGIFSFFNNIYHGGNWNYYCRGVAVCGEGM